ncbi:hypothetical protein JZO81_10440 [Enterococcus hulanensis]|uniref:hypothetical protein n=1 Tax=Enterococcus TaxID=1350 RepID=UPI000B5AB00E|nr:MULTISPECIES: hypothetical protein [Enterococcus]MBO0411480.1 hypothetical protein [Enterococcus hulanensis]OTO14227.1 hypothetical protein A5875_003384 [Enterococcus sp. 3H8_DIV0648]
MGKGNVGVGESWSSTVNGATKAVSSIGKIENIQLAKTDLEPFKQFEKIIPQINSSLSSFKSFTQEDGQKMIKAGENKKADDKAGSKTMNIQGKG